jgi:hypothetical protein
MSTTAHIRLLDDSLRLDDLSTLSATPVDAVVGLFWMAPSTRDRIARRFKGPCFSLSDIVGSELHWGEQACRFVDRIVDHGPRYDGIPWRTYLREPLYREALALSLMQHLARWSEKHRRSAGVEELTIVGDLPRASAEQLNLALQAHGRISYLGSAAREPGKKTKGRLRAAGESFARRIRDARASGSWRRHVIESFEAMDRTFIWRTKLGQWRAKPDVPKREAVLLSSYENNTRTLASFANQLPLPRHWVLLNESSRRHIGTEIDTAHWLWQFAPKRVLFGNPEALSDVQNEPLEKSDIDLEEWLSQSPTGRSWKGVESQMLGVLTTCWENYLEVARPSLVVTANQWGIDGWFTLLARRRGIPVLQIAHGLVGGYLYTRTPIVSDVLVVWGEFWRRLWPKEERKKIVAYNPRGWVPGVGRKYQHGLPRLTFFSWPLSQVRFYNSSDLFDGLVDIFQRLVARGQCTLKIRCHPLEDPGVIKAHWQRRHGGHHSRLDRLWLERRSAFDAWL